MVLSQYSIVMVMLIKKMKVVLRMYSVDRQTGLTEIFCRRSEIVIFPLGKQSSYSIHFK